jgi:hypothetical protein
MRRAWYFCTITVFFLTYNNVYQFTCTEKKASFNSEIYWLSPELWVLLPKPRFWQLEFWGWLLYLCTCLDPRGMSTSLETQKVCETLTQWVSVRMHREKASYNSEIYWLNPELWVLLPKPRFWHLEFWGWFYICVIFGPQKYTYQSGGTKRL